MTTPLDSMHFYTKLFTGMVLLLNIGLLVAIRMALAYAKHIRAVDVSDEGSRLWVRAKRGLTVLILMVVGMNAAAIFANQRMVTATRDIAAELPQDSAIALSMTR